MNASFIALLLCNPHGCEPAGAHLAFAAGLTFKAWGDCSVYANLNIGNHDPVIPPDGRYRIKGTDRWYECDWVKTTEIIR